MSKLMIALTLAATAFALATIPAAASPGATCARYASKAVQQQELNLRRHCGFAGPRWHTWWDAHYAWCLSKGAGRLASENAKRSSRLAQCLA